MPIPGRVDKKQPPDPTKSLPSSLRHLQLHLVKAEGTGQWSNPSVAIENTIESESRKEANSPAKLFVVTLLDRKGRRPFYVTDALVTLGFEGIHKKKEKYLDSKDGYVLFRMLRPKQPQYQHNVCNVVVVRNTPFYNRLLWLCKHLVQIKPITFPDGVPDASHLGCTHLNNFTGELRITGTRLSALNSVPTTSSSLVDRSHVRSALYKRYYRRDLGSEYFPTEVEYRYDLDKPGVVLQPKMYDEVDAEYL